MDAPVNNPRWYLLQTKPRQECRAEEHLRRQHFECYRPHKPPVPGQGKAQEALFPGYLFIRLDAQQDNWYPIRSTRGVARVVAFGGEPVPVRDSLIEQLRQRLAAESRQHEPLPFKPGDRVQLNAGSFQDLEAIFVSRDGETRAVILLNLLQREHKVRVPARYLSGAPCHPAVPACRADRYGSDR
ncbi:transcription/translation regulatory transformer protein RfaH [Pseudomonas sp.]|uniref:transcription/translation regulatory transformer protein RfaH n=1 Tax=Pseudomonas sp. TaxID=306 RepID=UPI0028A810C0|nr:transcription/translation regulatory transformer protein RfaH [Pseudomonas sp.]